MSQTPKRAPAKGKARAQSVKGCCCKRSQCIKNYCDCYQSMMVCTQFCRCVGCRNTEERMAVEPRTPARKSNAVKRDRAAAMTAKVAAAAAKEGIFIPVLPGPSCSTPIVPVPVKQPLTLSPSKIIRLPPEGYNVVVNQVPPKQTIPMAKATVVAPPATIQPVKDLQVPELKPKPKEPQDPQSHKTHNLFNQKVNEAILECILVQAKEAEQLGLNHIQTGRIVIAEFKTCFEMVVKKMLDL